jgi:hypothetical protein
VIVKRLIPLTVLLLAGCSSGVISEETTTLAPLPTTGVPTLDTLPSEEITYTPEQFAFFDDVAYFYGDVVMDNDSLLEFGELWCQLMEEGMGDTDVVERINEGATDDVDRATHFAILLAGIRNLCPSQSDKAEYIALNAPLP